MGADVLTAACKRAMIGLYADTSGYDGLPEPEFSDGFLQFIKKLAARVRRGKYRRLTRTAKIILVAAILALLAALSAVAVREARILLIDHGVGSYLDVEKRIGTIKEDISLGYIPEGFDLIDEENLRSMQTRTYKDLNGFFFTVVKKSAYSFVDVDTEGIIPQKTVIGNIEYIVIKEDDGVRILWMPDESKCLYFLNGNIEENEMLRIAVSCE